MIFILLNSCSIRSLPVKYLASLLYEVMQLIDATKRCYSVFRVAGCPGTACCPHSRILCQTTTQISLELSDVDVLLKDMMRKIMTQLRKTPASKVF